jgi:ABC-2 type transport system permease protein
VSIRGVLAVAGMEGVKLRAQFKVLAVLAACLVTPFAFALVTRLQSGLPEDTLFGRGVKASGFATPLFLLGFAGQWALPALTSVVGGDIFSAEDRYGTWKTLFTRSRSRAEIFAGKVLAAMAFTTLAVVTLAVSSVVAGVLLVGRQPLLGLSGTEFLPGQALKLVTLAWGSVLAPAFAFTALALLLSAAVRSSAAGVGLPVVIGLAMELYSFVNGPDSVRRLLLTSSFGAWHGLFADPPFHRPLIHSVVVSGVYFASCLIATYVLLGRRDITG